MATDKSKISAQSTSAVNGEDGRGDGRGDSSKDVREDVREEKTPTRASLVKRFGFYGFMFFLIKGLLWLIVPALMVYVGYDWGAE